MTTAHIAKFSGGEIHITSGGSESTAPNGKVLYKTSADGEWLQSNALITNGTFDGFNERGNVVAVIIPSKDASGNDVTSIGEEAFYLRVSLTSVTIPDSVTSIEERAFIGCSGLTIVTIPDGVTSIGDEVFLDCTSLTSITIPSSVETFGNDIITGCPNLHTINCPGRTYAEVDDLTQAGKLSRWPEGEGDYMNYICSDETYSVVAENDGEGECLWTVV